MSRVVVTLAGLALIILPVFTMLRDFRKLEVKQKGVLVEVTISKMPRDCVGSRRSKLFAHFEYQRKDYSMQISANFCEEYRVGQKLYMKHLDKYNDIFVFPKETIISDMIAGILLQCVGIFVIIRYSIYNRRRKTKLR